MVGQLGFVSASSPNFGNILREWKAVLPNADFVIEGCVDPPERLRDEGPFGDHTRKSSSHNSRRCTDEAVESRKNTSSAFRTVDVVLKVDRLVFERAEVFDSHRQYLHTRLPWLSCSARWLLKHAELRTLCRDIDFFTSQNSTVQVAHRSGWRLRVDKPESRGRDVVEAQLEAQPPTTFAFRIALDTR